MMFFFVPPYIVGDIDDIDGIDDINDSAGDIGVFSFIVGISFSLSPAAVGRPAGGRG